MIRAQLVPESAQFAAGIAAGAARTCYASRVIVLDPEGYRTTPHPGVSEAIVNSTWKAGHNTTRIHHNYTFTLEGVSRQVLWSFLHSHPFYNSEQVSQRYVAVKKGNATIPATLTDRQREIFESALELTFQAYEELNTLLSDPVREEFFRIFPARSRTSDEDKRKSWESAIKKRAQEASRYILPVATHAHLYHTISALTLLRLHMCADHFNVPTEQKELVNAMVDAVLAVDPTFNVDLNNATRDRYSLEDSLEFKLHQQFHGDRQQSVDQLARFKAEFDRNLEGKTSFLLDYGHNAERALATAVRTVLQVSREDLPDEQAIDYLLNPAHNHVFANTNNITTMTKLGSALAAVSYTFAKKHSHSADSQNQRHRMVPETAPIFYLGNEPDVVLPKIIERTPAARDHFLSVCEQLWEAMDKLRREGASEENIQYLAPNATAVRVVESGDLSDRHHKYTNRLCYNAQEEIWREMVDEVLQITTVHPHIGKHLLPPCTLRMHAGVRPYCPEGNRFCGVPVWKLGVNEYDRLI